MPYPNEYSCRLRNPSDFRDPWARVKRKSKSKGKTYSVVRGTLKATGKMADQAYRYPKDTWSATEARSHCKSHKGSYEAAAEILKVDAIIGNSSNGVRVLTRLATRVINTPLMISLDKLTAILNVLGDRIGLDVKTEAVESELSSRVDDKEEKPHIAVIPVHDTLVHRIQGISALSGLTTYEQIGESFRDALANTKVTDIILDIDSPGGEVSGVFDLVDEIYNARGTKPIIAAVNETAYSAAYAIASAADKVYAPRTGGVGSIGVIAVHTNQSGYDEKAGLKYTSIYAGGKKNDFSPHEEISPEALADVQSKVDSVYDLFVKTVARNRNINSDDVKATEAGIFLGEEGLEIGLIDQILSWNQIIETITTSRGGINMSFKEKLDALLAEASDEEIQEVFDSLGYTLKSNIPDVEAIKAEAKNEALEEIQAKADQDTQETIALRQEVDDLKTQVSESQKETEAERDARRQLELKQEIEGIGVIGDVDKHVRILFSVEKMNPELSEELLGQLRENSQALEASGFFTEIGVGGEGSNAKATTAFDQLKAKVDALKVEGVKSTDAWRRVARENPELYKTYVNGRK